MTIATARSVACQEQKAYRNLAQRTLMLVGRLEAARSSCPSLGLFRDVLTAVGKPSHDFEIDDALQNALGLQSCLWELENHVGIVLEYYKWSIDKLDRFELLQRFRRGEPCPIGFVRNALLDQFELLNGMPNNLHGPRRHRSGRRVHCAEHANGLPPSDLDEIRSARGF